MDKSFMSFKLKLFKIQIIILRFLMKFLQNLQTKLKFAATCFIDYYFDLLLQVQVVSSLHVNFIP